MQFLTFLTFFPPNFSFCALLQAAAYINNDPTNMTDTVLDVSVMHMEAILCTQFQTSSACTLNYCYVVSGSIRRLYFIVGFTENKKLDVWYMGVCFP